MMDDATWLETKANGGFARVPLDGVGGSVEIGDHHSCTGMTTRDTVDGARRHGVVLLRIDSATRPDMAVRVTIAGPMAAIGDRRAPDPAPWGGLSMAPRDVVLGLFHYLAGCTVENWTPPPGLQAQLAQCKVVSGLRETARDAAGIKAAFTRNPDDFARAMELGLGMEGGA
jgi:hypothetical protein